MNKLPIFFVAFLMVFTTSPGGLQKHRQSYFANKYVYRTAKDTLIEIGKGNCPEVEDKYIEAAKKRVISAFNTPHFQDAVTSLGFDDVTSNDLIVVTDPEACEGIKGYIEKWMDPDFDRLKVKVFLKLSDYYLIVYLPETLFGFGTHPIHLLTEDFKPKAVWLY